MGRVMFLGGAITLLVWLWVCGGLAKSAPAQAKYKILPIGKAQDVSVHP